MKASRIPKKRPLALEAAFEDGDQAVLMVALRQVAKARAGVAAIAGKSKHTREATHRTLSEDGNPALSGLTAVLAITAETTRPRKSR